jgi:hypothetical protein
MLAGLAEHCQKSVKTQNTDTAFFTILPELPRFDDGRAALASTPSPPTPTCRRPSCRRPGQRFLMTPRFHEAPCLVLAGDRPAARNTVDPSNAENIPPDAPGRYWRFLRPELDQKDEPAFGIDAGGSQSRLPERLIWDILIRSSPLVLARSAVSFLWVADKRSATPSIRSTPATRPQTL